ncbi:hypothetical protein BGZ54_003850 [Gamsiella multidivaricata]|nr:hypothetical protein BGZ54_003850 [Gamsiella multidivaricata]
MLVATRELPDGDNKKPCGVAISDFTYLSRDTVMELCHIFSIMGFTTLLRDMLDWVKEEIQVHDSNFATWFYSELLNTPGIVESVFKSAVGLLSTRSVLYLKREDYIDDEAIRVMLELYAVNYAQDGRDLFIPPLRSELWRSSNRYAKGTWDWQKEDVAPGRFKRAFAVVQLGDRWGVLMVDFTHKELSFGDSLLYNCLIDAVTAIMK